MKTLQNATRRLESRLVRNQYLGARVRLAGANYDPDTNRADVVFNVQAGPKVQVDVAGAHLSRSDRRRLLPIYQQNGLTPEVIQEGRQNLLDHFRKKGYFDAQVEVEVQSTDAQQSVLYRIARGPRKNIVEITPATGASASTASQRIARFSVPAFFKTKFTVLMPSEKS